MSIVILYGTESGNAELAADDLAEEIGGGVSTQDLSDVDPSDLDVNDFHVVICSTYGDGELPESARPFVEKLEADAVDLSGVVYAVFGMGDRSYGETFGRGGEILDEKLTAHGARRVGEFGHHDAGGRALAGEAAIEWYQATISTLAEEASDVARV